MPGTPYRDSGDALARQVVRLEEIWGSFQLCRQALEDLSEHPGDGPWAGRAEPADGTAWGWAEAPQGELLYLVETKGAGSGGSSPGRLRSTT